MQQQKGVQFQQITVLCLLLMELVASAATLLGKVKPSLQTVRADWHSMDTLVLLAMETVEINLELK